MSNVSIVHQLISQTNPQWHEFIEQALLELDSDYLNEVLSNNEWLPGRERMLAAFTGPLENVRYVLLGESPYPRAESANGYAFWDNAVGDLWSEKGLSKTVNRATSLRNLIKMLLLSRGDLTNDFSQQAIAALDKSNYWQTGTQLFSALIDKGFLLLNATLIYREKQVNADAKQWRSFLKSILHQLVQKKPEVQLILFGRIAAEIDQTQLSTGLCCEHPYNISFITNPNVLKFFNSLDLLSCHESQ